MEQLRRAMANIQQSMGRLGPTHKLLFASLAVIAAMTLFLASRYAAKPEMVDLMAEGPDAQVVRTLTASGINARVEEGRVVVPPDQQRAAVAALGEAGKLPGDTTILFNNLIQSQDWKASREQHRQQRVIAYQNELSRIISMFRGVSKAMVILDVPEASGLGRAVREPSASVTLFTAGGAPLPQHTVDAAARMVAGAQAGLAPSRVQVIDGSTGRARTVSDAESIASGQYLDRKKAFERDTQQEIERLLGYIPGVVVSVNAVVDVTRVASTRREFLPNKEGSVAVEQSRSETEDTVTQAARAAEPGVRSNQTADINAGVSASGTESTKTTEDSDFEVGLGSETTEVIDPRGMPTRLSASIMVPLEYVEGVVRQSRAPDKADQPVTDEEARQAFEAMKGTLEAAVMTKLETADETGQVRQGRASIAMVPMGVSALGGLMSTGFVAGAGGPAPGGGAIGSLASSGVVESVVLGVLALVAFGMMLSMVKRAGRKTRLPTAEELVGLPPALEVVGDLVGEADESDAPMAGIEITEDEVNVQKVREQVTELISRNPESAATLIGRWISEEE